MTPKPPHCGQGSIARTAAPVPGSHPSATTSPSPPHVGQGSGWRRKAIAAGSFVRLMVTICVMALTLLAGFRRKALIPHARMRIRVYEAVVVGRGFVYAHVCVCAYTGLHALGRSRVCVCARGVLVLLSTQCRCWMFSEGLWKEFGWRRVARTQESRLLVICNRYAHGSKSMRLQARWKDAHRTGWRRGGRVRAEPFVAWTTLSSRWRGRFEGCGRWWEPFRSGFGGSSPPALTAPTGAEEPH